MSNVRNYEEYRAEVLDRLGDDYTVEDLRNTERWRLRVLDMLSGGGSGGGGSSDFSTAEVTININNFEEGRYYSLFDVPMVESGVVVGQDYDVETATELLTIPIGSNGARFESYSEPTAITGNATYVVDGKAIIITVTGDAVINFEIEK